MYSLSGRLNYIIYNTMFILVACGVINHLSVRFGHHVGLRDGPLELKPEDIQLQLKSVDQFLYDRYFKEEALSFSFDMKVDLTPLMNWNTHTIFASVVCEYDSDTSAENSVTVWDQRVTRENTQHHQIDLKDEHIEYYLTDINRHLKDNKIRIYFRWEYMSVFGTYFGDMVEVGSFTAPSKYMGNSKRQFRPGPKDRQENY